MLGAVVAREDVASAGCGALQVTLLIVKHVALLKFTLLLAAALVVDEFLGTHDGGFRGRLNLGTRVGTW